MDDHRLLPTVIRRHGVYIGEQVYLDVILEVLLAAAMIVRMFSGPDNYLISLLFDVVERVLPSCSLVKGGLSL